MSYIFFIYGLSFFSFGLAVLLYPKMSSFTTLTKHFWMLGVFGLIHGMTEWIDMFIFIEESKTFIIEVTNFILLPFSYLFLLYFGLVSMAERSEKFSYRTINIFILLLLVLFLLLSFNNTDLFLAGNVWARYLFGIPGIFLTAYVLFLEKNALGTNAHPLIKTSLLVLSFSFFSYGVFAGVIVPDAPILSASMINYTHFETYVGLPVQLFRAFCAFISAFAAIALFKILRQEIETNLMKLSSAIDHSGDSVVITDKEGIIEYVNPAYEKHTGFTRAEALGQKSNILRSGSHSIGFYHDLWETILSGNTFTGYMINKKKSGELYHEHKAIAPIYNNKGKISHFVSTGKDVTEHMVLEKRLEVLAATDKLTGIANRLRFDEVLSYSMEKAMQLKTNLSLILFDIDDFKKVNDTYGHLYGDYVLEEISKIGNHEIRQSDLIARWGGEEFIILQFDTTTHGAEILAERVRHAIETHNFKKAVKVTVSLGVTTFQADDTRDSFIERVDKALYLAKEKGKNRVETNSSEILPIS